MPKLENSLLENSLLEKPSLAEKQEWIEGPGKDHWVSSYAKVIRNFKETSCQMTAAILRWRWTNQLDWTPVHPILNIQEFHKEYPLFQVEIEDGDHVFLVNDGRIYQSWWNKFDWDFRHFAGLEKFDLETNMILVDDLETVIGQRISSKEKSVGWEISIPEKLI